DLSSSKVRETIVRDLVKLGDDTAAEALTNADAPLQSKARLLGELGAARAEAGDIEGAGKAANTIASLGPSTDPVFGDVSAQALKRIGIALADAGATDRALRMTEGMTSKAAVLQITARVAAKHCNAANPNKGRALADRAAAEARALAVAAEKPFQMFDSLLA